MKRTTTNLRANHLRVTASDRKAIADATPAQGANALNNSVRQYLADMGCKPWRNNTGVARYEGTERKDGTKGKDRYVAYGGGKGASDNFAVNPLGWFVVVETKTPHDSASPEQIRFIDEVNAQGGIGFFSRALEDCEKQYIELLNERIAEYPARLERQMRALNARKVFFI